MNGPHHLRVTEFPTEVIDATERLFNSFAWRGDNASLQIKAQAWSDAASMAYGIEAPTVLINPEVAGTGLGFYDAVKNVILLPKMSVITLFHCFRYAVQSHNASVEVLEAAHGLDRFTSDAAAYSTSLFHTVRPALFRAAVERPDLTVAYVAAEDLQVAA